MNEFSHVDQKGHVRMVDVTEKKTTDRTAAAQAVIGMRRDTLEKILRLDIQKGNVLETARIAGILAAKKTSDLIPMCHPLNITHVSVDFSPDADAGTILITARVRLTGRTGVEMEALMAASIAALTLYDMCKSHDREMKITEIALLEKSGGKSGRYKRKQQAPDAS